MTEEAKITKADVDKAVKEALDAAREEWDTETQGLKQKNQELLGKLRKASEITPEEVARIESERDKAVADLADAKKQLTAVTKERDAANKSLETEKSAARSYALDAEISSAIAAGNVVPALVPAFTALLKQQAKADLADGKYAVTIGDKPAGEYIKGFLDSEDGKAYRAASVNGGGGAQGGQGGGDGSKTILKSTYNETIQSGDSKAIAAMNQQIRDGAKVVDQAA